MRTLFTGLLFLLLVSACKSDKSEIPIAEETKELTLAEKIANAHGFENWKTISEVKFTFQVDRDTIKGKGRSWVWNPKKGDVTMMAGETKVKYNRASIDSTHIGTDRGFINDKFWLLVPFQLVWDSTATISEPQTAKAPISKTQLNKVTFTYPNHGGYTPGDAYDIFYNNDFMIKEWVFRKGNTKEPTMATTFENYQDYNGIKIATDHKMANGSWNLNFTNVKITSEK